MPDLTWEQKYEILEALCPLTLKMRHPGNWYVSSSGRGVQEGSIIRYTYGEGETPQAAVEKDYVLYVSQRPVVYVSRSAEKPNYYRWNGYMWAPTVGPVAR